MGRESQSKKKETNGQMDNTNRKCIFGNDLLQGTQSNVGFFHSNSSSRLLWTQLNALYNCPFLHISQEFVESLCSFFYVFTSFEQKERLPTNVTFQLIKLFC